MFIRKLWKLFSLASHFIIYQYCFISTVTDEEGKNANCEYIISPIGGNSVDARQSTTFRRLYLVEKKRKERKKTKKS